MSISPQYTGEGFDHSVQTFGRTDYPYSNPRHGDDGGIGRKDVQQRTGERHQDETDEQGATCSPDKAPAGYRAATVKFACTIILPNPGSGSLTHRIGNEIKVIFEVHGSSGCGNGYGAQAIDALLNHDVRKREQTALQPGGNADKCDFAELVTIDSQLVHAHLEHTLFMAQEIDESIGGKCSGDDGSQSHAFDTPTQTEDKQQIERDVDEPTEKERVKRPPRVALRTKDGCCKVVEHQEGHACKINAQVENGLRKDIVGGGECRKNGVGNNLPEASQEDAAQ